MKTFRGPFPMFTTLSQFMLNLKEGNNSEVMQFILHYANLPLASGFLVGERFRILQDKTHIIFQDNLYLETAYISRN